MQQKHAFHITLDEAFDYIKNYPKSMFNTYKSFLWLL